MILIVAISRLTTSNLPWLMGITFQVPIHYCSLQHRTLLSSPVTSTTGLRVFILSGIISPPFSCSILCTYWPGEFIFQCPVLFAFSYCSWGPQDKNSEVVCHSLLQWTTFCWNPPPWYICLGWPYTEWLLVSLS